MGGRGDLYEEFVEDNYRHAKRDDHRRHYQPVSNNEYLGDTSPLARSYSKKMQFFNERSQRHGIELTVDQIYSSDISVLKKLMIVEKEEERLSKAGKPKPLI